MPLLIAKVTVLFLAALAVLPLMRRAAASLRHLVCVCAFAGSLILPLTLLFPARTFAIRLPAIDAAAASVAIPQTGRWPLVSMIFGFWALGCGILILRLAIGHWRISRLIRSAACTGPDRVCFAGVNGPLAAGLVRPVILMPRSSAEWPEWQFEAAIRHERMHLRRKDLWANLAAHLACALWWFHPLAWLLLRNLRDQQEAACDDAILAAGLEPATYAEALLGVARTSTSNLLPGCSMTTQMNLKNRLLRLLDGSTVRTTSRSNLLRTAILFAGAFAAIAVLSPSGNAQSGRVYKVGGDVTSPRILYRVDPDYTEEARQEKISGTVTLAMVIGTDGLAHDINVQRGLEAGLDRNAALAVAKWHFAPGTLRGEPVAVRAIIEVNFRLK